jgi:uncharacterized protein YndB with AHSA1/START domain
MPARNTASAGTQVERAADNVLLITRVFRARPETVFDAMTKPELMKRWWAPTSLGVIIHSIEADLRVGGRYRYVFGKHGEPPMAFNGVYKEFDRPHRVVYTQVFEPMPQAGEGLITVTYEPHDEGTLYTQHEQFPSKQVLDGVLASGMEKGMRETLDSLAELVPTL